MALVADNLWPGQTALTRWQEPLSFSAHDAPSHPPSFCEKDVESVEVILEIIVELTLTVELRNITSSRLYLL